MAREPGPDHHAPLSPPEQGVRPRWRSTGSVRFPVAALVDGRWWVLRINSFPDHPLWTLFVDGVRRVDVDEVPEAWGRVVDPIAPRLAERVAAEVLRPVETFVAYGSEGGQPCDNPFCCG